MNATAANSVRPTPVSNAFFKRGQLFGFTGTPIFAENNVGGVTTKDVFEECLHKYIITHAISDKNVLGFAVEYVGKYRHKEPDTLDADIFSDTLVEGVDTKEVLESDDRLQKITEYVLADWKRKTKRGKYNAIFAVPSVEVLKRYYERFRQQKPEDLKIATVFTYQANEAENADMLDVDVFGDEGEPENQHSRDFLEECIREYNATYGCNYSTDRFYEYYKDVQKRMKNKEIDLLIVVNMFLTGFDSPRLNTLYVDKNLRYHGLIQAYSRTNRLLNSDKPHGNIVSFRNLKKATDDALALFGDENAKEVVFKQPYEQQKQLFEEKLAELREIAPTVDAVDSIRSEEERGAFVKAFRDVLRLKSSLETYAEFSFADLGISEQEFYDYQSKYLDIHEERKRSEGEKESILDEIDFELELTAIDIIDYDYIIKLIAGLKNERSDAQRQKKTEDILRYFERDVQLRKKKELVQKFIEESLPQIPNAGDVEKAFDAFWDAERAASLQALAAAEEIPLEQLKQLVSEYLYTRKRPKGQDIADSLPKPPPILQRKTIIGRIQDAIQNIVDTFEW